MKKFSDLKEKLDLVPQLFDLPTSDRPQLIANARRRIINAHGKFYGLRSKYDGNGKLREPLKA